MIEHQCIIVKSVHGIIEHLKQRETYMVSLQLERQKVILSVCVFMSLSLCDLGSGRRVLLRACLNAEE